MKSRLSFLKMQTFCHTWRTGRFLAGIRGESSRVPLTLHLTGNLDRRPDNRSYSGLHADPVTKETYRLSTNPYLVIVSFVDPVHLS